MATVPQRRGRRSRSRSRSPQRWFSPLSVVPSNASILGPDRLLLTEAIAGDLQANELQPPRTVQTAVSRLPRIVTTDPVTDPVTAAGASRIGALRRDMDGARHRARSRHTDIVEGIMTMTYAVPWLPVADQ
jgi:hypothetical protein